MLYGLIPPCCSIIVNTSIPSKPRRCARFGWNMMKYAFYATTYQSGGEGQGDTHLEELLVTRAQSMSWTPVPDVACIVVNVVPWDNVPGKISRRSKTFPPRGHFPGQPPGQFAPQDNTWTTIRTQFVTGDVLGWGDFSVLTMIQIWLVRTQKHPYAYVFSTSREIVRVDTGLAGPRIHFGAHKPGSQKIEYVRTSRFHVTPQNTTAIFDTPPNAKSLSKFLSEELKASLSEIDPCLRVSCL